MLELDDERDDDVDCVNSSEIPLLPSTDPVWTLAIGLQRVDVVLVRSGVGWWCCWSGIRWDLRDRRRCARHADTDEQAKLHQ